jgi:23S rRNA (uracil-5-)-methyltransferase RumA
MSSNSFSEPIEAIAESILPDLTSKAIYNQKNYYFKYVLPGDKIQFIPMGRGKRSWNKILEIQYNSVSHEKCLHFRKCGGCRAQHIEYKQQFELKTKPILDYYSSKWSLDLETALAEKTFHYRNRMDFAVFPETVGLREEGNFRKIVQIERCEIQTEKANRELQKVNKFVKEIAYNRKSMEGFLKYITIRHSRYSDELLSIFTFTKDFKDSSLEKEWIQKISQESIAENIVFCYNRNQSEVSANGEYIVVKGKDYLLEEIFGVKLKIPFDSFFQTNPSGFTPILDFISKKIQNKKYFNLLDLFCGSGFFSLLFANHFSSIYGWDISESSIQMANSQKLEIYPNLNIQYEVKNLYTISEEFVHNPLFQENTLLMLDPPRAGIGKELQNAILKSKIQNICYISCNPYSQIEDIESLREKFIPVDGLVTDPYPHTPHLESVLFLRRINE